MIEFKPFPKIARLSRECVITEKIDGTNASVFIPTDEERATHGFARKVMAASRTRWIEPGNDNYGFAKWVDENWEELLKLGPGHHFGEWWGQGIQRAYGLSEKRFSLFNVSKWSNAEERPKCCHVVPILYRGPFETREADLALQMLKELGSTAAPGFMRPEGIIVYHTHANICFKKTIDKDDAHKGE